MEQPQIINTVTFQRLQITHSAKELFWPREYLSSFRVLISRCLLSSWAVTCFASLPVKLTAKKYYIRYLLMARRNSERVKLQLVVVARLSLLVLSVMMIPSAVYQLLDSRSSISTVASITTLTAVSIQRH